MKHEQQGPGYTLYLISFQSQTRDIGSVQMVSKLPCEILKKHAAQI